MLSETFHILLWKINSGNKNMVPLKVANLASFCFIGTRSCPKLGIRTCTDCRNEQRTESVQRARQLSSKIH